MKITTGFNKSEIAKRYYEKIGKPSKSRVEGASRLNSVKVIDKEAFYQVFEDLINEQNAIIEEEITKGNIKFYSTKIN